jgi:hypothetical protein
MVECVEKERINGLDKAINGNGSEGLKQKVVRVEENIKSLNSKMTFNTWLTGAMLAAIIGSLVKAWM